MNIWKIYLYFVYFKHYVYVEWSQPVPLKNDVHVKSRLYNRFLIGKILIDNPHGDWIESALWIVDWRFRGNKFMINCNASFFRSKTYRLPHVLALQNVIIFHTYQTDCFGDMETSLPPLLEPTVTPVLYP